jgi:hypothetical protein
MDQGMNNMYIGGEEKRDKRSSLVYVLMIG